MPSEINRTLLQLAIARTLVRKGGNVKRPIRACQPGDCKILEELIPAIQKAYRSKLLEMRTKGLSHSPDFQKIKHGILTAHGDERSWGERTVNLYSSVISTFGQIKEKKNFDLTVEELQKFSEVILESTKYSPDHPYG